MNLGLKEKVIIVTGGARGIGERITRSLFAEGMIPVIVGRNEKDNKQLCRELTSRQGDIFQVVAELNNPEESWMAVEQVIREYGRIEGLVNNAGVNDGVGLEHGSNEQFMASLHKNVVHYYLMAHFALPKLKKSRGAIVNISSKTAKTGQGNTSAYAAANGGRNALTREWAVELLKYGMRVNAVVVSESWTPLYERWIGSLPDPEQKLKEIKSRIPLGNRMTTTEDIEAW